MNRGRDLWLATLCSVGLHVAGYAAVARMGPSVPVGGLQLFKLGHSSVALTILPPVEAVAEEIPEVGRPEPVAFVDPVHDPETKKEPVPAVDADLEDKGVMEYASESVGVRPVYPRGSRLRGEEGLVRLRVQVGPSGEVNEVGVVESSGYKALDRAAAEAFRSCRFPPEPEGSKARTLAFGVRFRLEDR